MGRTKLLHRFRANHEPGRVFSVELGVSEGRRGGFVGWELPLDERREKP